jgi:hypothetical protein
MPTYVPLLDAIQDALSGAPVESARARWSRVLPVPWYAWLAVALARQLVRQRWLMDVWRGPLWRARHDDEGDTKVPGLPGWRYFLHGIGLCLTAPDGEIIDVDDHGDGGLTIDPYFFAARIRSLPQPAFPEQRLRAFLPTADVIADAIRELAAAGVLVLGEHGHVFRVVPQLEEAAGALAGLDFSSPAVREHWMEHLGDHLLGADARAAAQQREYERYLFAGLDRSPAAFIEPLEAVLTPDRFVEACSRVIDGTVGAPAGCAIERLDAHPDYPFCAAVVRLLQRADPGRHHPYAPYQGALYLLHRGIERPLAQRVALAFARVDVVDGYKGNPFLDDLALLLLEHVPDHALPHLRRALRASTCGTVAAALAVLDQPWCHRELGLALEEATTFGRSAEIRAALVRSSAPGAREAVERWVSAHVMPISPGPGYTWEEVTEANAPAFFQHEAEKLRPWAERLRATLDPDFDRLVWA